jgi:hypothetical protein
MRWRRGRLHEVVEAVLGHGKPLQLVVAEFSPVVVDLLELRILRRGSS